MKNRTPLPALLAGACLLGALLSPLASAQQNDALPPSGEELEARQLPIKAAYERRIDKIQWQSIPITSIVEFLREQYPEINFVTAGELDQIVVSLELRTVSLRDIVKALQVAGLSHLAIQDNNTGMISIMARQSRKEEPEPVLRVFNLQGYLKGLEGEAYDQAFAQLHEVLHLCWELQREATSNKDRAKPPRMEIHKATKLLIMVGQTEDLIVADEVISNLGAKQVNPSPPSAGPAPTEEQRP